MFGLFTWGSHFCESDVLTEWTCGKDCTLGFKICNSSSPIINQERNKGL